MNLKSLAMLMIWSVSGLIFFNPFMLKAQDDTPAAKLVSQARKKILLPDLSLAEKNTLLAQALAGLIDSDDPSTDELGTLHWEIAMDFYQLSAFEEVIHHFQEAAQAFEKVSTCDSLLIETYRYLAVFNNHTFRPREALNWCKKTKGCLLPGESMTDRLLPFLSKVEGEAYRDLGQLDSAIQALKNSFQQRKRLGADPKSLGVILNSIGATYMEDKSDSAKHYLIAALNTFAQIKDTFPGQDGIGSCLANLGSFYNSNYEFDMAELMLETSARIKESLGQSPIIPLSNLLTTYTETGKEEEAKKLGSYLIDSLQARGLVLGRIYYSLVAVYRNQGELDSALQYVLAAKEIFQLIGASFDLSQALMVEGDIYKKKDLYDEANQKYLESLALLKGIFGDSGTFLAMITNHLTENALRAGNYEDAIRFNDQAFHQLGPYMEDLGESIQPFQIDLMQAYSRKAYTYWILYRQKQEPAYLDSVFQTMDLATNSLQRQGHQMHAGDYLIFRDVFDEALRVELALFNEESEERVRQAINRIFILAEKKRASLLRLGYLQKNKMNLASLPGEPRAEYLGLEQKDRELAYQLRRRLSKGEIAYDLLEDWAKNQQSFLQAKSILQAASPDFSSTPNDLPLRSLNEIQQLLSEDEVMLEYIYKYEPVFDSTYIYTLVLKKQRSHLVRKVIPGDFGGRIEQFRRNTTALAQPFPSLEQQATYVRQAYELYQVLWDPVKDFLWDHERVMIVPDGPLSGVPFDALLEQPVPDFIDSDRQEFRSLPYLINRHTLSYQFSAEHWALLQESDHPQASGVLGIAPAFDGRRFEPLTHTSDEVSNILAVWGGKVLLDSAAQLAAFVNHLPDYDIIHVASHAKANNQDPQDNYIVFYSPYTGEKSILYLRDIHHLAIDVEMLVLSACETSSGIERKGEGTVSLAHAFAYAGSKSVVSSLWAVNDSKSSKLMKNFYTLLREGKRKDEAMRSAKLALLSESTDPYPVFWSGFVTIGDMRAFDIPSWWNTPWFWGVGLLLLLLGAWLLFRRQNSQTSGKPG
ncbi:MAG: CHAT domain-containing protein [Bacteroidota bacterium]